MATLPAVGERVGPCTIERELARGGMGAVYVARDGLGRQVAVKMLLDALGDGDAAARFAVEAQAAARVDHPGVVRVHAVGRDEQGRPFLVQDLIDGEALDRRLERDGALAERDAAALTQRLAETMAAAHAQGVLHRDLKPANVLIVRHDGRPVITDFGLARVVDQSQQLTQTGQVLGTPAYMPPEQANGDVARIDARSDVYALGATLYALLTGARPFADANGIQLIAAVLTKPVPPPSRQRPELDGELETICLTCMEKEPGDRYASAQALADDLGRWLRGEPIAARRSGAAERAGKWMRRNPALMRAGAGLLAALTLGAVVSVSVRFEVIDSLDVAAPEPAPEPEEPPLPLLPWEGVFTATASGPGAPRPIARLEVPPKVSTATVFVSAGEGTWMIECAPAVDPAGRVQRVQLEGPGECSVALTPRTSPRIDDGPFLISLAGPAGLPASVSASGVVPTREAVGWDVRIPPLTLLGVAGAERLGSFGQRLGVLTMLAPQAGVRRAEFIAQRDALAELLADEPFAQCAVAWLCGYHLDLQDQSALAAEELGRCVELAQALDASEVTSERRYWIALMLGAAGWRRALSSGDDAAFDAALDRLDQARSLRPQRVAPSLERLYARHRAGVAPQELGPEVDRLVALGYDFNGVDLERVNAIELEAGSWMRPLDRVRANLAPGRKGARRVLSALDDALEVILRSGAAYPGPTRRRAADRFEELLVAVKRLLRETDRPLSPAQEHALRAQLEALRGGPEAGLAYLQFYSAAFTDAVGTRLRTERRLRGLEPPR